MKTEFKKVEDLVALIEKSTGEDFNKESAERFASYCLRTKNDKDKQGNFKNSWMQAKSVEELDLLYRRVKRDGMDFDGVHITLQSTGVSYDYVAYKNKMLMAYPESKIDIQLVYEGDGFNFTKDSGEVIYSHHLKEPFNQSDSRVIGGYCVVKNKRGQFLTILSSEELEKHRKAAKTDSIWKFWFKEMCMKTIIKKAVKYHFQDVYEGIDELDNENYEPENVGKSEIDILNKKIVDGLAIYQGDDVEVIRQLCYEKRQAGEFTISFAKSILKQLGENE